ncbi:hypothetical protein CF326_g8940, partial [Tilletia indica]
VSTPSREGGSIDPDVPRSSASESSSAPAEGSSARSASTSVEADPLRSSTSDPAAINPLDTGIKTTATPGGVIMSNATFQELVSQARAGGAVISGDREEAVFHPSFRVSDGASTATVKVWFGSPLAIPDDLVRAFNAGNNIPLSLLTVAAIRDFGINQRRSTFQPKMSGRLLEEFESWHSRDDYLPFAEWCQAIFTLIHLFRSVRAAPPDESPDDDPIYQLTEHALSIISRANAYAWPVYRDYDKRVRQEIWSARHRGVPIPFRINSLHIPTLDDAEVMIKGRGGALADFAAIIESGWSAVVMAPSSEVTRLGRKLDESHSVSAACILEEEVVPAGPPQAHAGYSLSRSASTSKRKASEDANGSPNRSRSAHHSFQRSVSAPFFPPSQQPSFPPSPQPAFPPSQHSGFQPPPFSAPTLGIPAPARTRMVSHPVLLAKAGSGRASSALRVPGGTQALPSPVSHATSVTTACSVGRMAAGLATMVPGTPTATSLPLGLPPAPVPVLERLRPTTIRDAFGCVSTTLHAHQFQLALDSMPLSLRSQYAYIPGSILSGFSMGNLQLPSTTVLHPNHYKADRQPSIDSWAAKSKAAGFIAGPWPVDEVVAVVGPIHASPISIVDKFDKGVLVKERIVYDASYPQYRPGRSAPSVPSINSQILKEDYPCEWMTAIETKHLLRTVPSYARFAGFDLKDAFQQLGNSPSQRNLFCIHVLGLIYVWLVGIFGLRSICGIFGALCDVTCWYIEFRFPQLLLRHYVDDFLMVDLAPPSSPHAGRSFSLLLDVVRSFGWEIHPEKFFP